MTAWIDRLRERSRLLDLLFIMIAKGNQDGAGRLAALISFYTFFSVFPLLLVLVWVLGLLLDGNLRDQILDSALAQFPVIGTLIRDSVQQNESLTGGVTALVVGLAGALWAGMKAFDGFQYAMRVVWHGPLSDSHSYIRRKLRALGMMGALGIGLLIGTAASGIVTIVDWIPGTARPLGLLVTVLINSTLVAVMYVISTPNVKGWRPMLPGAVVAGTGLTVLYAVGTVFLTRVVRNAGDTYGIFAIVLGLLTWLNLIATLIVWSAELNTVLAGQRAVENGAVAG